MEPLRPEAAADMSGQGAHPAARRPHRFWQEAPVFAVVAAGGALGAGARYGATLLWPMAPGAFPWTTLVVNVTGCAVMGIFMVLAAAVWWRHHLLRPFVGTGILGGYTTFSAYAADIRHLLDGRQAATALAYLALTVTAALAATWAAAVLTQRMIRRKTA